MPFVDIQAGDASFSAVIAVLLPGEILRSMIGSQLSQYDVGLDQTVDNVAHRQALPHRVWYIIALDKLPAARLAQEDPFPRRLG